MSRFFKKKEQEEVFIASMVKTSSTSRRVFVAINTIILSIAFLLAVLPVIHILAMSFSSNQAVIAGRVGLWPVDFTIFPYQHILNNPQFFQSFFASIQRIFVGVPFTMLMIILIAYPLSRSPRQFVGRRYYVWFFLFSMLFSGGLVPLFMIVRATNIFDTRLALILPHAVSVFNMLILMNFFRNLPAELSESAMMDGAGHMSILLRIFLPLSKAALATLVLFTFVHHWNEWFHGLIFINNRSLRPLQTYLREILTFPDLALMDADEIRDWAEFNIRSVQAAQIFITMAPILIVYPFLQKYFTKGITLGSVKG